jgi:phosphotransferase system HPr-like phosphotransfer protein
MTEDQDAYGGYVNLNLPPPGFHSHTIACIVKYASITQCKVQIRYKRKVGDFSSFSGALELPQLGPRSRIWLECIGPNALAHWNHLAAYLAGKRDEVATL